MVLKQQLTRIAENAKISSAFMLNLSSATKNKVILEMASGLNAKRDFILKANKKDIAAAKRAGLSTALIDRLTLNPKRIKEMSDSLLQISRLKNPVGEVIKAWRRPNGLRIQKVRVPIGVIAIIY